MAVTVNLEGRVRVSVKSGGRAKTITNDTRGI